MTKRQNPFNPLNKPFNPSEETKIGRERLVALTVAAIPEGIPNTAFRGVDVSEWNAVLGTIHPSGTTIGDTSLVGITVDLRVWRWRRAANGGNTDPSGQWFAEEEFTVALDGDMTNDYSMERIFTTNVAEQMYLEVVGYNAVADDTNIAIAFYGIGSKRGEAPEMVVAGGGNRMSVDIAPASAAFNEVSFPGDHIYSNHRDDFTAVIASLATITLAALPAWITVTAPKIVAIGIKPDTGEADWNFIYLRGSGNLQVSYAAGTITFDENVLIDTDYDVGVWIEEIPKYQVTGIDDTYRLQTRDEAFTIATTSERVEEIDPIDTKYVGDVVADVTNGDDDTYNYYLDMSTYRKLGLQLELDSGSGSVTVTIEGTIQDDGTAAAACLYQDIGSATFGAANWAASAMLIDNAEKLACYKYIKVKVVAATGGADDADWTIYAKRLY